MSTACEPGAITFSARAKARAEELMAEIKKLQKENENLRRQREILKEAASILAEDPQMGTR